MRLPESREAIGASDLTQGGGRRRSSRSARVGRILLQVVLTAGVTWLIVSRVGVTLDEATELGPALPGPRPGLLAGATLLLLCGFVVSAGLWGRMVAELGGRDPGILASTRIVLTANLGRYLPGKVWQIAGLVFLSRRARIPGSVGAAAGALGQGFHLAGAAVVGLGALLTWQTLGPGPWLGLAAVAAFVAAASIPAVLQRGMGVVLRMARLDEVPAPRPDPLFGPRWVLLHAAVWCLYGGAFVLMVRGLGLDAGSAPLLAAAFAAAYLLGYLAVFAPAGIGIREGVLIGLVRPSLGVAAVGVAVLARVWMTVVELLPAGGVAIWEIFRRRHGNPERRERGDG